ncbi:Putative iron-sulfur cluster assembly scaffold protein for SUF system, SufE2 [Altererythrobacter epoxidivorans]|uniref:Putative iron-sulfur cluster assembly scaffold protein for SUF system, SufE2 n=1 Tax=Altererythrobacter epoxidivorans TaxID=361183 RepID=A0A0M4M7L3_9SPHN|nr:iron-sulfur cluster assembly scaffold protein [Altererythrobacter epoxidivorans]ALE16460.1 Putative iron-sulfur cluster assembly scaffold protein for SUF system, SufE2 [Altererythrobacter epoxidivorans]
MHTGGKLYTPELLALATSLFKYPLTSEFPIVAEARSRTCGSSLKLGFALDEDRRVKSVGLQAAACAVGQASCAIFAQNAVGLDRSEIQGLKDQIEAWLAGGGSLPDWPQIECLAAAREHAGRHGAILLPWNAALDALSSEPATR